MELRCALAVIGPLVLSILCLAFMPLPRAEQLMEQTLLIAKRIASLAPLAVRQAKHSIHHGLQMDLNSAMLFEIEAYQRMVKSEDRVEGVLAFNEKRPPIFKGR